MSVFAWVRKSAWCAHHTRAYATERVVAHGLSKSDAPFITLDELRRGTIPAHLVRDRKDVYEKASSNLPSVLSTLPLEEQGDVRVISQGKARGWVVDETHLLHAEPTKDYILFTDTLRPDLVRHFPRIKAIITRAGSTLSHLAIVARESHIPVVVDPHCAVLTDGTYMMDIDTSTVLSPHK